MTVSNCLLDPTVSPSLRYFSPIYLRQSLPTSLSLSLFFYFILNFKFFFDVRAALVRIEFATSNLQVYRIKERGDGEDEEKNCREIRKSSFTQFVSFCILRSTNNNNNNLYKILRI